MHWKWERKESVKKHFSCDRVHVEMIIFVVLYPYKSNMICKMMYAVNIIRKNVNPRGTLECHKNVKIKGFFYLYIRFRWNDM